MCVRCIIEILASLLRPWRYRRSWASWWQLASTYFQKESRACENGAAVVQQTRRSGKKKCYSGNKATRIQIFAQASQEATNVFVHWVIAVFTPLTNTVRLKLWWALCFLAYTLYMMKYLFYCILAIVRTLQFVTVYKKEKQFYDFMFCFLAVPKGPKACDFKIKPNRDRYILVLTFPTGCAFNFPQR